MFVRADPESCAQSTYQVVCRLSRWMGGRGEGQGWGSEVAHAWPNQCCHCLLTSVSRACRQNTSLW